MLLPPYTSVAARLLSGDISAIPSRIYVEFENVGDADTQVTEVSYPWEADSTQTADAYFNSLSSPRDYVVIALELPKQCTGDSVTYHGIVTPGVGSHGVSLGGPGVYSKIVSMAVVTPTGDIIAHQKVSNPLLCVGQFYFTYTLNLDTV